MLDVAAEITWNRLWFILKGMFLPGADTSAWSSGSEAGAAGAAEDEKAGREGRSMLWAMAWLPPAAAAICRLRKNRLIRLSRW